MTDIRLAAVPGVVFGTEQLFGGVRILFGFLAPVVVPQMSLGFATSGEKLKLIGGVSFSPGDLVTLIEYGWGGGDPYGDIEGDAHEAFFLAELGLQWHLKNRVWQPSGATEG